MAISKTAFLTLLGIGMFVLSLIALMFGFGPPWATVGADTDADDVPFTDVHLVTMDSTPFENEPANITAPRHVARNLNVGHTIQVCTSDYTHAVGEAVSGWNVDLRFNAPAFLATDAFAAATQCIGNSAATDIQYAKVESRRPDDNDF